MERDRVCLCDDHHQGWPNRQHRRLLISSQGNLELEPTGRSVKRRNYRVADFAHKLHRSVPKLVASDSADRFAVRTVSLFVLSAVRLGLHAADSSALRSQLPD
jgi:hypothetical protein